MRGLVLVLAIGCGDDKHALPKVVSGSNDPVALPSALPTPTIDTSSVSGQLRSLFGATQSPDTSGAIAKLEAQRATMPEAERKLVDRSIAIIRSGEAAAAERDRLKSRPLQLQLVRDTMALLDDMAAVSPDDLETTTTVAGSLDLLGAQIESMGLADDIPPRTVKAKARALADRMIKVHPNVAKAWLLHASVTSHTPYTDREGRLRDFARCVKLEPANTRCNQGLAVERADWVRPYCEGADIKPGTVEWRAVSLKPTPGYTPIEHHYETWYVAPVASYSIKDVVRVESGETTSELHRADGIVERQTLSTVSFTLPPKTLEAMKAWSRALEKQSDGYGMFERGTLLFIDRRAMFDDSAPGVSNAKIEDFCTKTKTRALPAD